MAKNPFFGASILLVLLIRTGWTQVIYLRGSDTRTAVPSTLMSARKSWGLDLSYGGTSMRGNRDLNYNSGSFSVFKACRVTSLYADGSVIYNTFGKLKTVNQGRETVRYDFPVMSGSLKGFVFDTNAYNEFLLLDHRMTNGAGLWRDLPLAGTSHGLSLALTHEYEKFRSGVTEHAFRASFRCVSNIPVSRTAELDADIFYVPKINRLDDRHFFAELSLQSLVWKDKFGLRLSFVDEYDSRPKPGVRKTDMMWLTSVFVRLGK